MTMTRTTITQFVNSLAHSLGNSDTLEDTYDDVLERLARVTAPFVNTEAYTPTDGTEEYSYPSTAVTILAAFHGAKHLIPAGGHELEAYDESWRATAAAKGTPVSASYYERDARKENTHRVLHGKSPFVSRGHSVLFTESSYGWFPDVGCFAEGSSPKSPRDRNATWSVLTTLSAWPARSRHESRAGPSARVGYAPG